MQKPKVVIDTIHRDKSLNGIRVVCPELSEAGLPTGICLRY